MRHTLLVGLLMLVLPLLLGKSGGPFRFDYVERHGREIWVGCNGMSGPHTFELYEGKPDLDALVGPRVYRENGSKVNARLIASATGDSGARLSLGGLKPEPEQPYTAVLRNQMSYAFGMDVTPEVMFGGSDGSSPFSMWCLWLSPVALIALVVLFLLRRR